MSNVVRKLSLSATAVLMVGMFMFTLPAAAATFNPGTVAELTTAIETANLNSEADIINLTAGAVYTLEHPYTVGPVSSRTDSSHSLESGLPLITSEITINGNGATIERSSAAGVAVFRIFEIGNTGSLTLNVTTLTNGGGRALGLVSSSGRGVAVLGVDGGAISSEGTLVINNCILENNLSLGFGGAILNSELGIMEINTSIIRMNSAQTGGGIASIGTLTCTDTDISQNTAMMGCGLLNLSGTATLYNCTVNGNHLPLEGTRSKVSYYMYGGGIVNVSDPMATNPVGLLELYDCTIKDNLAYYGGGVVNGLPTAVSGAVPLEGTVVMNRCTISTNTALLGGGFFNLLGSATIENSN